jgi:peptide/nickel transport system substrate-binding protein
MRKLWLIMALGALLAVAGCGGDDEDEGKKGGTLTVMAADDIVAMDPGAIYYQYDYMVVSQPGHRALYGWKPDETKPTPDLAASMPQVSDGGKTVTIKLRKGVRFSPPVSREAEAKDVKYAIERIFLPQVGNSYAAVYFGELVGSKEFTEEKAKEIKGIETPDPQTLVLKFNKPVGLVTTANALTLPGTAPVPKEYAAKYDKGETSTYGDHAVFTGPYMVKNDGKGNITGFTPGKRLELVRNPNWDPETDYRPAYLDRIISSAGNDTTVASRRILSGRGMVSGDFAAPPTAVLKQAVERNKDQLDILKSQGNRFISLNTTVKPFDDVNVRKAVAAVIDREQLRLTRGGPTVGDIANHFIPPEIPGFEEAGGIEGTGADFMAKPKGDLALAQEYMRKAGYENGRYDGPAVLMVGDEDAPNDDTAEAVQASFQKLGFKLNFRLVPRNTMFSKFCGVPDSNTAVCATLGWGKDFYDAQSFIDPVFNGKNIVPVNNTNYAELNDPKLNAAMDKAATLIGAEERAKAWGELDRQITEQAVVIPWLWDNQVNLRSRDVKGVVSQWSSAYDVTFSSIE